MSDHGEVTSPSSLRTTTRCVKRQEYSRRACPTRIRIFARSATRATRAVAYVIAPTLVRTVAAPIAIETRGEHTLGMTVVDLRGPAPADCVTNVTFDLDAERFWALVVDALERIGEPA